MHTAESAPVQSRVQRLSARPNIVSLRQWLSNYDVEMCNNPSSFEACTIAARSGLYDVYLSARLTRGFTGHDKRGTGEQEKAGTANVVPGARPCSA